MRLKTSTAPRLDRVCEDGKHEIQNSGLAGLVRLQQQEGLKLDRVYEADRKWAFPDLQKMMQLFEPDSS